MKQGFLIFLSLTLITQTFSQTSVKNFPKPEKNNTLLWRISGNGLKHSSYLFGTMHLNDKRLFNFDDSVYRALEKCEGMAMEVNPDELMAYMVNKLFDDELKSAKLKSVLSPADFKRYNKGLSRKFRKSADELRTSDIIREKNNWVNEYLEKGEMPTFVDAYLYNLARKQGKWVGGIEDITDQTGLMEENFDRADIEYMLANDKSNTDGKKTVELMIRLYQSQDINGIDEFINGTAKEEMKDFVLIRRNLKMARRMDSLSALRTMFFAVGAAHLPGDSGVIKLLKERGFSVTPVFSSNKIESKNYKPKEIDIPWTNVADEKGYYNVEMPLNPASIKLYGLVDMKFLIDISNFSGYYTMAAPSAFKIHNRDSALNKLAQQVFQTSRKLASKPIEKDGIKGLEFIDLKAAYKIRLHLYSDDNVIYAAAMFALKPPMLQSEQSARFFNSFQLKKPEQTSADGMYVFADPVMGVRLEAPAEILKNEQLSNHNADAWDVTTFTGTDPKTGSMVMLFSRDVKPGYVITSDSLVFASQYEMFKSQYTNLSWKEIITKDGRIIEMSGLQKENPSIFSKAHSIIRDNRNVLLIVIADSSNFLKPEISNIFKSLSFTPPPIGKWNWYGDNRKGVKTWAPAEMKSVPETFDNRNQLMSYDTTNSTTYFIACDTLGKYDWYNSDSALFSMYIDEKSDEYETVYFKDVAIGKIKGKEILCRMHSNYNLFQRLLVVVSDSLLYRAHVTGSREMVTGVNSNKFFDSLKITHQGTLAHLRTPKAELLIRDLSDTSVDVRYAANSAIDRVPFETKDIPLLHKALFRNYLSTYDSTPGTGINSNLMSAVVKLKSPSTSEYIRSKYAKIAADSSDMQLIALAGLARMKTSESYATLAELLTKHRLQSHLDYSMRALEDSLTLTKSIFPQLLELAGDSNIAFCVASVAVKMVDSNLVDIGTVRQKAPLFIKAAGELLPSFKNKDYYRFGSYSLLELLGKTATPESFDMLRKYLEVNDTYLSFAAFKELIRADQQIPALAFEKFAADTSLRISLYETLEESKKLHLFPKKFLSQASLAQSILHGKAYDDDYEYTTIEPIGTREGTFKDNKFTFYLFKVTYSYEDETHAYLGISDGYKRDKNALKPVENTAGVFFTEEFNKSAVAEQFKTFLQEKGNSIPGDEL